MDPDVAHARIAALLGADPGALAELREAWDALDDWLARGGFLPKSWAANRPDDTYVGWRNRETWALNLWLSNDELTSARTTALVGQYETVFMAGEALKTWVSEELVFEWMADYGSRHTMLDVGSLWRIDWEGVAGAFRDD